MKKIYTLILSITLFSGATKAQLSLTKTFNEPVIGDVNTQKGFDSTSVIPKNPGASQTWNFSSFTSNTVTQVSTYTNVASTPSAASFPSATIAESDGSGNYTYYQSTTSSFELNGLAGSAFVITFTNNATAATWPVNYLYSNNDTYAGTASSGTMTGSANGTIITTAPGNGVVMLPGGITFTNALQVKSTNTLSANLGTGFTAVTLAVVSTDYTYYSSTQKFPVITISYQKQTITSILGPTVTTTADIKINNAVYSGINEYTLDNSLTIYPNPATNYLTVSLNSHESTIVEIINQIGQVIKSEKINSNTSQIDISTLCSGVYFIKTTVGNKFSVKKLIKD